jgi:oligopeptide transport system permease protein
VLQNIVNLINALIYITFLVKILDVVFNSLEAEMINYILKRIALVVVSIFSVLILMYMILDISMMVNWLRPKPSFFQLIEISFNHFKVYFSNIINDWNFGTAMRGGDVWELIGSKLLNSMQYYIVALFVFVFLGILLGVTAAVHKNKIADFLISALSMIFNAIPAFVVIFFLVIYVGYIWDLLPPQAPYPGDSLWTQLVGLIIPVTALAIGPIGKFALIVRGEIIENLESTHFLLLRTKGLTRKQAIYRHAVRESLVVIIPEIIPTFVFIIGMSFFIESVYSIPGISNLFFHSISSSNGIMGSSIFIDINVVVAIGILIFSMIMVFSLFADLILFLFDPRIKITGKKS